jgi:rare lipoprotein A
LDGRSDDFCRAGNFQGRSRIRSSSLDERPKARAIETAHPGRKLEMRLILFGVAVACSISCASADEFGVATYYRNPWHGGLIAAHPSLPFGTRVRVYDLDNGRDVTVVIVDRGPFARGRIIDISTVAADVLGIRQAGIARVRLERLADVGPETPHISVVNDPEIVARMIGARTDHTSANLISNLTPTAR